MLKNTPKRFILLAILTGFLALAFQNWVDPNQDRPAILPQPPQWSETTPKIVIDGMNPVLGWGTCPWANGNGTVENPYILKDLVIDAGGIGSAILMQNTRDYFQIQNCTVLNSHSTGAGCKFHGR